MAGRAPAASAAGRGFAGSAARALALDVQRARAHRVWFGLLTVSAWNHNRINKRSMLGLFMSFHVWHVDNSGFLAYPQDAGRVLPVKPFYERAGGRRDPQHFHRGRTGSALFCTSDPHACAHGRPAVLLPAWQPAGDHRTGPAGHAHPDPVRLPVGVRSSTPASYRPACAITVASRKVTRRPHQSDRAPPCMRWRGPARPRRAG